MRGGRGRRMLSCWMPADDVVLCLPSIDQYNLPLCSNRAQKGPRTYTCLACWGIVCRCRNDHEAMRGRSRKNEERRLDSAKRYIRRRPTYIHI